MLKEDDKMNEFEKTVLCPTDFTTVGDKALLYASKFCEKLKARLIILHTINEAFVANSTVKADKDSELRSGLEKTIEHKLEKQKEEIKERCPELQVETIIGRGKMEDVVTELVTDVKIALMVVGYLGDTGANTSFGITGIKKLMEKVSIPILIVPLEYSYSHLRYWLYTSGLENDEGAMIEELLGYSEAFDAHLELLYVRQSKRKKMEELDEYVRLQQKFTGKKILFTEIEHDDILEGIEEYAWSSKPDLLIVTKRSHSQLEKLFKKDKVTELVNHTDLPVLLLNGDFLNNSQD